MDWTYEARKWTGPRPAMYAGTDSFCPSRLNGLDVRSLYPFCIELFDLEAPGLDHAPLPLDDRILVLYSSPINRLNIDSLKESPTKVSSNTSAP